MSSRTAGATASLLAHARLIATARRRPTVRPVNASLLEHARLIATAGRTPDTGAATGTIVSIRRPSDPVIRRRAS